MVVSSYAYMNLLMKKILLTGLGDHLRQVAKEILQPSRAVVDGPAPTNIKTMDWHRTSRGMAKILHFLSVGISL
jgi:hypothetical protein